MAVAGSSQRPPRLARARGADGLGDPALHSAVLAEYPKVLQASLARLWAAHREGDWQALQDCARLACGSAACVGAERLQQAARALAEAAAAGRHRERDLETLLRAVSDEAHALCKEAAAPVPAASAPSGSAESGPGEVQGLLAARGPGAAGTGAGPPRADDGPPKKCQCALQ